MNAKKTNIVVTGGSLNALGVLRSLKNHHLTLLCDEKTSPAWHSRYIQKKVRSRNTKTVDVVSDLLQLGTSFANAEKPLLFLTEEKTVLQVSLHRHELEPYFRFLFPSHDLLTALQSKSDFQRLAEQSNSPIPKAVILRGQTDVSNCKQLQFPCVLKPLEQNEKYSQQFKKAYKVASLDEVSNLYSEIITVMPDMIVQEWIEGDDSDIYFCLAWFDEHSELVHSFTGRKIRSWPRHVGGTAACTSAPEVHEELSKLTAQFVRSCSYVGLMGMEFKYDKNRAGFFMIEPTVGRTDYQHEIATLSGHNFLAGIAAYFNGELIPKPRAVRPVIWQDDVANANAIANGASQNLFIERQKISALWRWSDPAPSIAYFFQRIRRKLHG